MDPIKANRRVITRQYFRLLPLQVLLMAISAVNNIINSLFASNVVGGSAMSVIALYAPITMLMTAVNSMFVGGSQLLCGKYMGKNQLEHTRNIYTLDLLMAVVFAALLTAFQVLVPLVGLTRMFTPDPDVQKQLGVYLLGSALGIVPLLLSQQLAAFLSLENQTRLATIASVAQIVANLALDFLFTAVMKQGVLGLGLATALSSWVFFAIQAQHFLRGKSTMKFKLKGVRLRESLDIIKIGWPGALNFGYQALRGVLLNVIITAHVGVGGLSAYGAVNTFLSVFWSIPLGMAAVGRMLISVSIGEEDRQTLTDIMRVMFYRCVPLMCVVSAGLVLCAAPLAGMYYHDAADPVYQMTLWGFRIIPLSMPLSIVGLHFSAYGQAMGKKVLVQIISLLDGVLCVAGFSALLVPLISINGVYVANICNGLITAAACFVYAWICNRRFPRTMDELMVIPDGFGVGPENRLDLSVRDMAGVVTVSQQVRKFLAQANVDRERTFKAGLCLEEMAGNVIEHGFTKDNRRHSVDIRVAHKGDDLILRIKDDCVPFDPATRASMLAPEDVSKNIGIRMVYDIADKVEYQSILGLNVLTIRI